MPNYSETFRLLAERAVAQGGIDAKTFMARTASAGISETRLMELLEQDLEQNGPIFGKFLRSMVGASQATITSAGSQGQRIGEIVARGFRAGGGETIEELLGLAEGEGESVLRRVIDEADPDGAEEIERSMGTVLEYTWVATLIKTCERCLPLHGQTRTFEEWSELGFLPETIHDGWDSSCQCQLIPHELLGEEGIKELKDPLIRTREKLETSSGLQGVKKTARATSAQDMDRALKARNDALSSVEGRRTLRILGQSLGRKDDE
jgi:hypothetical protein